MNSNSVKQLTVAANEVRALLRGVLANYAHDPGHPAATLLDMANERLEDILDGGADGAFTIEALVLGVQGILVAKSMTVDGDALSAALIRLADIQSVFEAEPDQNRSQPSTGSLQIGQPSPTPAPAFSQAAQAITPETHIEDGGAAGEHVLHYAAVDIFNAVDPLMELAHQVEWAGEVNLASQLRAQGGRIHKMSSLILSYIGPDSVTLKEAYAAIHGQSVGARRLADALEDANAAPAPATEAEYMDGVNLMISLLHKATQMENTDAAEPYRWMRLGAPVDAFATGFLLEVMSDPTLLPGFGAALSAVLGAGVNYPVSYLEQPYSEFMPGPHGADGTAVGEPDPDHPWANTSLIEAAAKPCEVRERAAVAA